MDANEGMLLGGNNADTDVILYLILMLFNLNIGYAGGCFFFYQNYILVLLKNPLRNFY